MQRRTCGTAGGWSGSSRSGDASRPQPPASGAVGSSSTGLPGALLGRWGRRGGDAHAPRPVHA